MTTIEMEKAGPLAAKPLTVTFGNGEHWLLEVPANLKGNGEQVVKVFA